MSLKRIIGIAPILYLILLSIGYSLILSLSREEGRDELATFFRASKPNLDKKKVAITAENLEHETERLAQSGILRKAAAFDCWSITSDSTAWIASKKDTFFLKSTHRTLRHPNGIAILRKVEDN